MRHYRISPPSAGGGCWSRYRSPSQLTWVAALGSLIFRRSHPPLRALVRRG